MPRPYLLTTRPRQRTWAELTAPLTPEAYAAALADTSIEEALEQGRVEAERERIHGRAQWWDALRHGHPPH